MKSLDDGAIKRFWSYVSVGDPDACWVWTGRARAHFGYGKMRVGGRSGTVEKAHRISWVVANGDIPEGKFVLHTCDNPPCCNPSHLFLGTKADNTRDMMSKGRMKPPPAMFGDDHPLRKNASLAARGSKNGNSRYTSEQARRAFLMSGTYADIASVCGVSVNFVNAVKNRHAWMHATNDLGDQS